MASVNYVHDIYPFCRFAGSQHVDVDGITHDELLTLTSQIHHKTRAELEGLLLEADRAGKGEVLRQAWKQDVEDRAAFQKGNGKCRDQ